MKSDPFASEVSGASDHHVRLHSEDGAVFCGRNDD